MEKNILVVKKHYIQRMLVVPLLLSFLFSLFACESNAFRYETQDINYYFELKQTHPFYDRFFPSEIDENSLERFSYIEYLGETRNIDVLLSLKYLENNEFEEALLRVKENIHSEYYIVEQENLLKEGYTSIFMGGPKKSSEIDSPLRWAWLEAIEVPRNDKVYMCSWDMILYSQVDKVIIFNSLSYQSYIGEEFDHSPYIEEALGVKIEDMPTFNVNNQEVITPIVS